MVVSLWRVVYVWHESIRQRPEDIGRTLIACNTRHRLTGWYIVNRKHWGRGVVVSLIVSCSNIAHLILTYNCNVKYVSI